MENQEKKISGMDRQELLDHYEAMREIASRDALTGLLNRGALEEAIDKRLKTMTDMDCCALFIVDLDNFKAVNDNLGHQAGDRLLARAAGILSGMFRATDIVGRLGGDEFVVFLNGNLTEDMIKSKGQAICDQLQFALGVSAEIVVTASVGIHLAMGGEGFDFLYHSADLALYKAKKSGKQTYCIKMNTEGKEGTGREAYSPVNALRIRSLLDYIDSGVAMLELGEPIRFVYASPAFARMMGVEPRELSETPALDYIHPDDRELFQEILEERVMKDNESVSHVMRVLGQGNHLMWWRIHAVRVEYNEKKPVILTTAIDISELKEKESMLEMNNSLYQLAMDQTAQGIWELDLPGRIFRLIGENKSFSASLAEEQQFPEALIDSGWIHPEEAESFRNFAEEILNGRMQGYGNFKIRYRESDAYGWASFSYRAVLNETGRPVRVVGVIEGMKQEAAVPQKQETAALPESLMDSLVLQMSASLTEDVVYCCWREGKEVSGKDGCRSCTELLEAESSRIYSSHKNSQSVRFMTRDFLLLAFMERKEQWTTFEYQRIDNAGHIGWVSCSLHLHTGREEDKVQIDLWLSRLDKRHHWENMFGISIYKDPISKLYTRSTVREISTRLLEAGEQKLCALVMIEIGGMARLYSHDPGDMDAKWRAIILSLLLAVGTSCVPGQFGTDRYLLFFPEISGEDSLRRKLEQAFIFVRTVTSHQVDGKFIRFLAGGVCRYQKETDYDVMIRTVQSLCQKWSNSSGDRIVFEDDEREESREQIHRCDEEDQIRISQESAARPLSDREKDVAFHCLLDMFQAESLESLCRCVLSALGEYYHADRTYILVPIDDGSILTMPHEWTSGDKHSIQQIVSGSLSEQFPAIEQCAKTEKPVYLTRQLTSASGEESQWHFAVFPMWDGGRIQSYLCIENAKHYIADAALISILSSCLLKERRKNMQNTRPNIWEGGYLDTEIPNQSSYMEVIYSFNSDIYSSLGVVSVDVPEFSAINGSQGFEYGRKLLWYTIQMMAEIFGRNMLYRTWDAEFVALCPNTTQQIFHGKCARLRAVLTRRYPRDIRIGYTWSDKVFEGKALADEAKVLMRCDRRTPPVTSSQLPPALAEYGSVGEMVRDKRFTVFFQPKLHMETGRLAGAEALVRGLDRSGKIIPPVKFIEEFEKDGSVRDLDLFVLDRTMKTMERWRQEGKQPVPVSVNFSRLTLFDPRIFASVLAIHSRYPDLDPALIEIEITESAGAVDLKGLATVMEQFRNYGFVFSLDDFGSKYSNLSVFTNIYFETVKLDRSLVSDIVNNENNQILVKDIVEICHNKNIRCIAEGVETMEQIQALTSAGCLFAQGYYYDRPLPEETFFEKYYGSKDVPSPFSTAEGGK